MGDRLPEVLAWIAAQGDSCEVVDGGPRELPAPGRLCRRRHTATADWLDDRRWPHGPRAPLAPPDHKPLTGRVTFAAHINDETSVEVDAKIEDDCILWSML